MDVLYVCMYVCMYCIKYVSTCVFMYVGVDGCLVLAMYIHMHVCGDGWMCCYVCIVLGV